MASSNSNESVAVDAPQQADQVQGNEVQENGVNNGQEGVDAVEHQVNGMSLEQQSFDSDLHRFCAEGKLDEVRVLLSRSLEGLEVVEMTTGCTPIVLAIQNNHPDIVRELLSAGAIIPPPGLTADPLLNSILYPQMMYNMPPQFVGQHLPPQDFFPQGYYPEAQRGGMFMPFPNQQQNGGGPGPHRKEASPNGQGQGGVNNLPPAEVAKTIPCRNFPNCKYGSSCAFSHPRPGFFPSAPMPNNGNFMPSYDQFGSFQPQPGMAPFYPNDFNSNGFSRSMAQDQSNGQLQQQQQQQIPQQQQEQQVPASQDVSENTQHDSTSAGNHVPSALTPAFIPSFQPAQPQQIHQQLDPQSYLSSPPPASQFGLSPMSPSLLTSPPPSIPSAEAFFAASPPNGGMMLPPAGMMQSLNGMNGNGHIRRQSFNQQFGVTGRPFGHGKKPSFSGPGGPKSSWMGRPSVGTNGANANLGSWKDGIPPPCAFYSQAKCRNGDYCKFPHLDAEGNDTRHPDVVRGIIPPAPPLARQPRPSMRMMPPNNFGPFDPNFRQQQAQQQLHFLQQQKMAAAHAQQMNGTQPVAEVEEGSTQPAEVDATPVVESDAPTSTAPVLPPSVPAKPTTAAPPIIRSASQPGVNRTPVSGISSRAHSPAPSNVSFHGNGHPRRAGSRVPYPNGQAPTNGVRSTSSQSADSKKVNGNGVSGQRIPGADEFPALSMGNGEKKEVGWGGKTAAQVLSEPAPPKPVKVVAAPVESEDHEDSSSESQSGSQGVTMDSESDSDAVLISRKPTPSPAQTQAQAATRNQSSSSATKPEIKRAGVSFASVASSVGISASSAMESAPLVKA